MITLEILEVWGQVASIVDNSLEIDGVGGRALLTWDCIEGGQGFAPLVFRNFPNIVPRISVARETRVLKPGE